MKRLLLFTLLLAAPLAAQENSWGVFFEELEIDRLVLRWSATAKPATAAFIGVELIAMTENPAVIRHDQTVVVRNGKIESAGPRATTAVPPDALRIDARGKFLTPGLTDAHVHTLKTDANQLMNLFYGVTTVREMDGFPWLLAKRDAIRSNRLLGPTSYVAGTILNYFPMAWYAQTVKSVEQARQLVHEQKAAGYDYIKIHNVMPLPLYDAIIETAKQEHIRVIGHIPHEITVHHAIESGQFTIEHFKGFYLDSTLEMSTEDWLGAVKGADVWITPTLTTRRGGATDDAFMNSPDAQYISARARSTWPDGVRESGKSAARVWELSPSIFKQLLPVTDRIIAGTDSGGGYPNSVSGFALHDELETFESLGMPAAQVLRTATVNASIALGDEKSFGTIEPGKRADLLLLDKNPLETARNLRDPRGVMARGIWLDSFALDSMRAEVRDIYARLGSDKSLDQPSAAQISKLVEGAEQLKASGWIFRDQQMKGFAGALRAGGREDDAKRVERLMQ